MEIKLAKSAGFCFGVKRAVDMVYQEVKRTNNIYTYGPIIHNEEVVNDLANKGVVVIESLSQLQVLKEGTVIIRSHGVEKKIYDFIQKQGLKCVDATCPFVLKIHKLVDEYSKEGYHVIIIGNSEHPEVQGIRGWCNSEKTTVLSTREEACNFKLFSHEKVCIVSQTTFNYNKFKDLVEIINEKGYDIIVLNTICNATEVRQREASEIAGSVEAMVVIGGSHSSNTQKLFEICKEECENTYYIQTLDDLDLSDFRSIGSVGITAGASTPNNIIEEVQRNVRNEF